MLLANRTRLYLPLYVLANRHFRVHVWVEGCRSHGQLPSNYEALPKGPHNDSEQPNGIFSTSIDNGDHGTFTSGSREPRILCQKSSSLDRDAAISTFAIHGTWIMPRSRLFAASWRPRNHGPCAAARHVPRRCPHAFNLAPRALFGGVTRARAMLAPM
jgi:hypothetical protein